MENLRNRSMETKRMVMEDLWIDSDGDLRDRSPIRIVNMI